ncbi:MAG TPA: hypothetical protein VNQ78_20725 [Paracoccus sp. (in: a-proteobacteria)]|uniref:hypothetical protein n=1 Tax=Paracoccus sp. TaxID=267 RepID=UPI002B52E4D0|nr:hypothetical protein [Paracoccus sp. (in: a-proteobacteria)]HWL59083.1 hypothetical protein [Paracoccus sp. (in: a-proteobacteria)]
MTVTRNGLALAALLALAGCDDRMGDYPALLPTDQLLAEPRLPQHAAEVAASPDSVAHGLEGRAAGLRSGPPAPTGTGADLAARADALRSRAATLSNKSLDACPDGAASCDEPAPAPAPAGN